MRERYVGARDDRPAENGQPDGGGNELVLQPCLIECFVIDDLVEVEGVEIGALVVVVHDGAGAPFGFAPGVFILQTDEEEHVAQSALFDDLCDEFDRAVAVAPGSPYELAGGSLGRCE